MFCLVGPVGVFRGMMAWHGCFQTDDKWAEMGKNERQKKEKDGKGEKKRGSWPNLKMMSRAVENNFPQEFLLLLQKNWGKMTKKEGGHNIGSFGK